jgi:diguanylate cyclase (GGDEF)-like protein
MVIAVVAACAVLVACGLGVLAVRRSRRRTERIEAALQRIDNHLDAVSESVSRAVESVIAVSARRAPLTLTLDFDGLLETVVAETAARTGADAVVLRVEGPGARPAIAAVGVGVDGESLDPAWGPPGGRRFDVAVIDWTYSPSSEPDDAEFRSALVTSLASSAGLSGTLAAYSLAPDAFGLPQKEAVQAVLSDVSVALANARRFAELEARVNTDPVTGALNRRGYEVELGREVARASRTGKPLSVVVVDVDPGSGTDSSGVGEVARLVSSVIRRSDISCRRGERELAIVLPETASSGAEVLTRRIEGEAQRRLRAASTLAIGLVERRADETPEELDARIGHALAEPGSSTPTPEEARNTSTAVSTVRRVVASSDISRPRLTDALHRDALEAVARGVVEAREFGRSLALVAIGVDGIDRVSERDGRDVADDMLREIGGRLDRSLGTGSVHRLDATTFALVLPGSGIHEAEALVDAVQASLEPPHGEGGLVLSAGVTELAESDDAVTSVDRAEHALWQAKRAGPGTVVVAVPGRRTTPPTP